MEFNFDYMSFFQYEALNPIRASIYVVGCGILKN
jgi:hypothetical protein